MNTAKLKAAAERVVDAYGDEWFEAGRQICTVHKSKICLISLSSPSNILDLIAALEAAQKRIDELEEQKAKWVSWAKQASGEVDKARQRIAELEARTVKLPPCVDDLHGVGMVMSADAVTAALSAAGINLETGGEA
ncbi:hypothetical protein [Cronobacter dublinensis]|uniref:hypothetical protein n=1 Tax=Cronobacter dublinensis TaxID=413497 RepID=UPI00300E5E80